MAINTETVFVDATTIVYAAWLNLLQEHLAGLVTLEVDTPTATQIRVAAGSDDDVAAVYIGGQQRYRDTPAAHNFTSEASGTYGVYVTAPSGSNSFDLEVTQGTPTISPYRQIATVDWNGSAISVSGFRMLEGRNMPHEHSALDGSDLVDHADLTDLASAEHTMYSRQDGTIPFTGPVGGVIPTLDDELATKSYITGISAPGLPIGTILPYAGGTLPAGWLLCDGASYLVATYGALHTAIGDVYGGDGGTNFNVPDMITRTALGKAASGTGSVLGTKFPAGAITLVGVGSQEDSTDGVCTPSLPLGWKPGDIHVALSSTQGDQTLNTPVSDGNDWNLIGIINSQAVGFTDTTKIGVWWRRAEAGDTAPTIDGPASNRVHISRVMGWRGCVETGDPIHKKGTGFNATNDTSVTTMPELTTTIPDSVVVHCTSTGDTNVFSAVSNPNLTGFAEIWQFGTTTYADNSHGAWYGLLGSPGLTGTFAATVDATEEEANVTFALIPGTQAIEHSHAQADHDHATTAHDHPTDSHFHTHPVSAVGGVHGHTQSDTGTEQSHTHAEPLHNHGPGSLTAGNTAFARVGSAHGSQGTPGLYAYTDLDNAASSTSHTHGDGGLWSSNYGDVCGTSASASQSHVHLPAALSVYHLHAHGAIGGTTANNGVLLTGTPSVAHGHTNPTLANSSDHSHPGGATDPTTPIVESEIAGLTGVAGGDGTSDEDLPFLIMNYMIRAS